MSITIEDISLDDDRVAFVEARPEGWAGYIKVEELHKALEAEGIPKKMWPSKPTPGKRLERAMRAQKDSRRVLIRPLNKAKGWSLVVEDDMELELAGYERHKTAHSVDLTCVVKQINNIPYVEATPWDHDRVNSVKQEFSRFEDVFKSSEDLSQWFSRTIIPWCRGVATRSRGGSYYVMKGDSLDRVRKVSKALAAVSITYETPMTVGDKTINLTKVGVGGRIILKPEVASDTAVEILVDNFIHECEQITASIKERVSNGSLGYKALTTQKGMATDQLSKLEAFEDLLDTKLDTLRESLGDAKEEAGMAALAALAKKEARDE